MADFASSAPRLAVLPSKIWKGIDRLSDEVPTVPVVPFKEAFTREWDTDAHFVIYLPFGDVPSPLLNTVRCNKDVFKALLHDGVVLSAVVIALEWDTPGHVPWTAETWDEFHAKLSRIVSSGLPFGERLKNAAVSYSTRKGWRWVWRLTRAVPCDEVEPLIRGLALEAQAAGFDIDVSGSVLNWAQPFRLPRVARDYRSKEQVERGEPDDIRSTSSDPFFYCDVDAQKSIIADMVPSGKADTAEVSDESLGNIPDPDECRSLLHTTDARGRQGDTPFFKEMKASLRGRDYWMFLFDNAVPLIQDGDHHNTIRAWTHSACGRVVRYEGAEVKHLYALFSIVTEQLHHEMPQREGGWRREVWRLCVGSWKDQSAEVEREKKAAAQKKESDARLAIESSERITSAVAKWHPTIATAVDTLHSLAFPGQLGQQPPPPISQAPVIWAQIRRLMILKEKRGSRYYVMRQDGRYSGDSVDDGSLVPQIIQQGMDKHIDVTRPGKEGPRPVKIAELALEHITNVSSVEYRCEIEGGFVENPTDQERLRLVLPSFRRNPELSPLYSAAVDEWLLLLGGRDYEDLCRHIGCFLAWERGGVAAMSFNMPPGAGKKILAHGLLECLEDYKQHIFATGEDLVQRFNAKLRLTPFIMVNEGMPESIGHYHASDMLRRVITGDYFQSEGKNKDSQSFKFPFRVLLTANHWRLIDALGEGRDLSPHEREALGVRLRHYSPDLYAAAAYLAQRGGEKFTRGWIEGDSGEPSQFIVARHFLWLYEKYGKTAQPQGKGRLLIEGDPNQEAIRRLRAQGGSTLAVIETLLKMLDSPMLKTDGSGGVMVKDTRLHVTVGAILDYWRDHLTKGSNERLTARRISLSLKGLVVGTQPDTTPVRSLDGHKERWNEIDVVMLATEAETFGWTCRRVDELLKARLALGMSSHEGNGNGHGTHAEGVGAR